PRFPEQRHIRITVRTWPEVRQQRAWYRLANRGAMAVGRDLPLEFRSTDNDHRFDRGDNVVADTGNRQSRPHFQHAAHPGKLSEEHWSDYVYVQRRNVLRWVEANHRSGDQRYHRIADALQLI